MIRKIYLFILAGFIVFVVALNTITFLVGFNFRQTVNIFYLSERTAAVMLLFEHIIFESGVILSYPTDEEIRRTVWEECSGTVVDPELVMLIINGYKNSGAFNIDFDGSMGLMRVKTHMLHGMMGANPYILQYNIKAGVAYLSALMDEDSRLDVVLCEYFMPKSSRTTFEKDVKTSNEQAIKIYNEYIKIKPQPGRPADDNVAFA